MKKTYYFILFLLLGLSRPGYSYYAANSYASGLSGGNGMEIPTDHLQLWLKSDTGVVLSGSKVIEWMDQSGKGNNAIESDTIRQPLLVNNVLNGYPVIRFDGYDDRLGFTGSVQMTQISLFMVFENKSGATGPNPPGFVLTFGPGGAYVPNEHLAIKMRGMDDSNDDIIVGTEDHTDYVKATGTNIARYNEWRNINIVRNLTVWNTTLRWDGINAPITTSGSNIPIYVPLGDSTASGGGIGSTDNFPDLGRVGAKCDIAEIIVYDTVLSDSVRLAIEKYLSDKYQITVTGVADYQNKNVPETFTLYQNYPNPFNPTTTIKYAIPKVVNVELKVFDILGREVKTLVNETMDAGYHEVQFNASDLASGIYFYRLNAGEYTKIGKMLLLK